MNTARVKLKIRTQPTQRIGKLLLLVALYTMLSPSNAAKFYRWTDQAGKVHYSSTPPPAETKAGYTKINESGRHIEKVTNEVANNDEAETQTKESSDKQTEIEENTIKKQYDNYLLASYLNIAELTSASQKKQTLLTEQIAVYKTRIKKLKQSVSAKEELRTKAQNKNEKAKLQDYIDATTDSIKIYDEIIIESLAKVEKIKQRYITDKARLTELLSKESKSEAE